MLFALLFVLETASKQTNKFYSHSIYQRVQICTVDSIQAQICNVILQNLFGDLPLGNLP